MALRPWQVRMLEERSNLDERRAEIENFISGAPFQTLDKNEQDLIMAQGQAMMDYSHVLTKRIGLFEEEPG